MENMVEVANYQSVERAEILASLLRSEGIDCYVRNSFSSHVFSGGVDIGARVELLESNASRALAIMKEHGYLLPAGELAEEADEADESLAGRIPFMRNVPFEWQAVIVIALVAVFGALIVYAGYILSR